MRNLPVEAVDASQSTSWKNAPKEKEPAAMCSGRLDGVSHERVEQCQTLRRGEPNPWPVPVAVSLDCWVLRSAIAERADQRLGDWGSVSCCACCLRPVGGVAEPSASPLGDGVAVGAGLSRDYSSNGSHCGRDPSRRA